MAPLKVLVQVANSSQGNKPWVDLDSHIDIYIVGEHCLVVCNYDHLVHMSGCNPHDGAKQYRSV